MKINILGDKIKRDTNNIILRINNRVYKIPVSCGAFEEIKRERKRIKTAKDDPDFLKYIPDYKKLFFVQSSPYYRELSICEKNKEIIIEYFKQAFWGAENWPKIKLNKIINSCLFDFINNYLFQDKEYWESIMENISMPLSSSHGDFYIENILIKENRIFFIDWSRYNNYSSRYFDLLDYYIFSEKKKDVSWTEELLKKSNENLNSIYKIKIAKDYFYAYALWKVAEEINILKVRKRFNEYKIKKYIVFLKKLKNSIN